MIIIDIIAAPLLAALLAGVAFIIRQVSRQGEDLAVLKDQIVPTTGRRLIDVVNDNTRDIALLKNDVAQLQEKRP